MLWWWIGYYFVGLALFIFIVDGVLEKGQWIAPRADDSSINVAIHIFWPVFTLIVALCMLVNYGGVVIKDFGWWCRQQVTKKWNARKIAKDKKEVSSLDFD